jgi:hypothetical protein
MPSTSPRAHDDASAWDRAVEVRADRWPSERSHELLDLDLAASVHDLTPGRSAGRSATELLPGAKQGFLDPEKPLVDGGRTRIRTWDLCRVKAAL